MNVCESVCVAFVVRWKSDGLAFKGPRAAVKHIWKRQANILINL